MKFIQYIFSVKNFILLFFLTLILCVIWLVGVSIRIDNWAPLASFTVRLIVSLCLFFVFLLAGLSKPAYNLLSYLKKRHDIKRAKRLSLAKRQELTEIDPDLKLQFLDEAEMIDGLVFGKGRRSVRGRALPWYAVIGPQLSGKSSFLRHSGLDFVITPDQPDSIGSELFERSYDWWVAEDAVFLESAGAHFSPEGTSGRLLGWKEILTSIKNRRPGRPLHGIIVALSFEDIVVNQANDRKITASILRAQLREMLQIIGARVPIYFVITKADRMSGFSETMAYLSEIEKNNVWGGSLPEAIDIRNTNFAAQMDDLFSSLIEEIAFKRNERLRLERDNSRRLNIFEYPEQLAYAFPILSDFLQDTFRSFRLGNNPMLRGVFLTSTEQKRDSIDLATHYVLSSMGLAKPIVLVGQEGNDVFFTHGIFSKFILPEKDLAGYDPHVEHKRALHSIVGISIATAVFLLTLGSINYAKILTERKIFSIRDQASVLLSQGQALSKDAPWTNVANVLDLSRSISTGYQDLTGSAIEFAAGIVHGGHDNTISDITRDIYPHFLAQILLKRIVFDIEGAINSSVVGGNSAKLLSALSVYLMLNDREHYDSDTFKDWVIQDWHNNYVLSSETERRLNAHLSELLQLLPRNIQLDQGLIAAARQSLVRLPTAASIYADIQSAAATDFSLPPFQRGLVLGPAAPLSLTTRGAAGLDMQIPGLYTKSGFESYILHKLPLQIATLSENNWVLGASPLSGSGAASKLLDQVVSLYSADYIRHWEAAIKGIRLRESSDLTTAIDALGSLSGPNSSLEKLIRVVVDNTNLVQPTVNIPKSMSLSSLQNAASAISETAPIVAHSIAGQGTNFTAWPGRMIQQHFASIIALTGGGAQGGAEGAAAGVPMDQARNLIAGAYSLLQSVASAPNPQYAALNIVKSQSGGAVGNALSLLMVQAQAYPPVVGNVIHQVGDFTQDILADLASQYIGTNWRQMAGSICESRIAEHYPFNPSASVDVALQDFINFFGPGGIVDSFFNTIIQPLGLASVDFENSGSSLLINQKALVSFQQARRIREAFFRNGQFGLTVNLAPSHLDVNALSDILSVGGRQYIYQHQPPPQWMLTWPITNIDPSVTFTVTDLKGNPYSTSFSGDWALFRFVSSGIIEGNNGSGRRLISLSLSGLHAAYTLTTGSLQNAFDLSTVMGFSCPKFN